MIINNNGNKQFYSTSQLDTKEMYIKRDAATDDMVMEMLTERSYKDPLSAVVRETYCNALDAMVEAGKKDDSVIIRVINNTDDDTVSFQVEDFGNSLSKDEFDKYIMGILESSKRESNDFIGGYGIGAKAPLSLVDSFSFRCRKNGLESKYLIVKGKKRPERVILYENETIEQNGTLVEIRLPSNKEHNLVSAIKKQLSYFPNIIFEIESYFDGEEFKIFETDLFMFNPISPLSNLHLSINGVMYPINFDALDIDTIYIPFALKVDIKDVRFVLNREEIEWTDEIVVIVKNKINDLLTYLTKVIEEKSQSYKDLYDAYDDLSSKDRLLIHIFDNEIDVSSIFTVFEKDITTVTSPECNLINVEDYFKKITDVFKLLYPSYLNYKYNRRYKEEKTWSFNRNITYLIYKGRLSPAIKAYLPSIYKNIQILTPSNNNKINAWWIKRHMKIKCIKEGFTFRDYVDEFNKVYSNFFSQSINTIEDLSNDPNFKEFNRRERSYSSSSYKALNKQKGEITLNYARPSNKTNNEVVIDKKTLRLEDIHRYNKSLIIFNKDEVNEMKKMYTSFSSHLNSRYNLVFLSDRELKLINKNHKKVIMFAKIKEKDRVKPLTQMATASLFGEELRVYNDIIENCPSSLKDVLPDIKTDISSISSYIKRYGGGASDDIVNVYKENKLFDYSLWNEYKKVCEFNKKFSFLEYLTSDRYRGTNEDNRVYFINHYLKMMALLKEIDLDGYEIVKKNNNVPDTITESIEEEIFA